MPKVHKLKTWPEYYELVESGEKLFEARKNDRKFKTGDTVILQKFCLVGGYILDASGALQEQLFRVGFVLNGPDFGIKEGHCVFSLQYLHT